MNLLMAKLTGRIVMAGLLVSAIIGIITIAVNQVAALGVSLVLPLPALKVWNYFRLSTCMSILISGYFSRWCLWGMIKILKVFEL